MTKNCGPVRYLVMTGVDFYIKPLRSNFSKTNTDNDRERMIRNGEYKRVKQSPHGHVKFKGGELVTPKDF